MIHMTLPPLFKLTSAGKIQTWEIHVETVEGPQVGLFAETYGKIVTTFGQVGGKMQSTEDLVKTGKNAGRANATSPVDQAVLEARSKWDRKKDSGYVEEASRAEVGERDTAIQITPMLAHTFAERGHKMTFPCAVQPKLDGIRCLAVIYPLEPGRDEPRVELWSRKIKPIKQLPHITAFLSRFGRYAGDGEPIVLDGELYNHALKSEFETITSIVRQETAPAENHRLVEYHVYDLVAPANDFASRLDLLAKILKPEIDDPRSPVVLVETGWADSVEDLTAHFDRFREAGYEGAMARSLDGLYEQKRSEGLLKVKAFLDADYEVTGAVEGRGKLAGHVGAFVCRTDAGETFQVKLAGDTSRLKELFGDPNAYLGRKLVVKYQGLTKTGVPRFPVGLRFKSDYE